jgi:hypothetical protein
MARLRLWCVLATCVWLLGCGGTRTASQVTEESTLKPVAVFYSRYISQHGGRPPADEAAFRKFLEGLSPDELKSFGVSSIDEMLVSKRDGQPYKILYGPPSGPPLGPGGQPIIAYESKGVSGKRFVASSVGGVIEVDDAEFARLVPQPAP